MGTPPNDVLTAGAAMNVDNMKVDMVADMKVDMVADMKVDMEVDLVVG